ncbi:MAG: ornithine carbamoyltransferase [Actinobacteria bacterium]|nr:ornithine carbamoyltransferase [Actinomycetota bacterium]NCW90861.1 ornithine carbamoyltransferase [Acidimicrobiia bacterium]NCV09250.1 ornithine carbamoyltransferase [Actinomycetota bacterium]NCX31946.1 ornithine carbamoyltransferase [Actinomycetota bacterium]NCZ67430.1 ornithine carbamoyltransferase [Acidimicrobiia bacterium]
MRHFLNTSDLTRIEIGTVLALAKQRPEALGWPLADYGVAMIFEKPSNRTRQSMEMAVVQLGGHPVFTRGEEVGFDVRESVEDITQILAGYHAILAARVLDHAVLERMAATDSVPVVNMLSDYSHPLQSLADVLTMREEFGSLKGRTVAWVGDYNNVARSLSEACALEGAHVRLGCPLGYGASDDELSRIRSLGAATVEQTTTPHDAVCDAHAVHTDVFVSMGQEAETERRMRDFAGFQVDESMMAAADPEAIFMHCLPAHRGVEVAAEVIDGPASRVVRQAHNRMHAARGLLAFLCEVNDITKGDTQ